MRIYNYLFYKTYQLAQRSRNFDDAPVLGGIMFVIGCVIFNIFTISFLLEGFGIFEVSFEEKYKYPFTLGIILLLLFYYYFNGRYKKIIEKHENKERRTGKGIHPLFVIIIYYGISFGLVLLSGLFMNRDWIFNSLPKAYHACDFSARMYDPAITRWGFMGYRWFFNQMITGKSLEETLFD